MRKKWFSCILLDDDQRRVVLTDEDYCLVVAGKGVGKTTMVAAKVKYLVEKQNIDSIMRLCKIFQCDIGDIVMIIEDYDL